MSHGIRPHFSPTWLAALLLATPAVGQDLTHFDAIRTQDFEALESLFDDEADPNRKVGSIGGSVTPLAIAIAGHREDVALWLLERGAKLEETNEINVIEVAAKHGMTGVLEFLVRQDPKRLRNPSLDVWNLSLQMGAVYGHLDVVELMLRLSQELGEPIPAEALQTAALAAMWDHHDIARRLIEVIGVPFPGALVGAAYMGSPGLVRELLDRGADPYEKYGVPPRPPRLPLEWAIQRYTNSVEWPIEQHTESSLLRQEEARLIVYELIERYSYDDELSQRAADI